MLRSHLLLVLVLAPAAPAAAQQTAPPTEVAAVTPPAVRTPEGEPRLVFVREVFSYGGTARRDPFRPLSAATAGPLFEELRLSGILHSSVASESIVLLSDATRKQYRLRRGDTVGNATVLDIGPSRVVFAVVDFGIRRQEVLSMKANREGADR